MLNKWTHLAAVYNINFVWIYMDGNLLVSGSTYSISSVSRSGCWIGRSNHPDWDIVSNSDYDELRIYNRVLNVNEIRNDMNLTYIDEF